MLWTNDKRSLEQMTLTPMLASPVMNLRECEEPPWTIRVKFMGEMRRACRALVVMAKELKLCAKAEELSTLYIFDGSRLTSLKWS